DEPTLDPRRGVLDAASEIPWEYLLSSATQCVGRLQSLLVTRCLTNGAPVARAKPRDILFVESAPGRIGPEYEFDDEEKRLKAAFNLKGDKLQFSKTEPLSELQKNIGKRPWDAVHVTGVDTHHAGWLVEDFYAKDDEKPRKHKP